MMIPFSVHTVLHVYLFITAFGATFFLQGTDTMHDQHSIKLYTGQEMLPLLSFVAESGIKRYRDYPYFFEADTQEVQEYLTWLSQLPHSVLAVAYIGDTAVGFSLGTSLTDYSQKIYPQNYEESMELFRKAGRDPERYYYITDEFVVSEYEKEEIARALHNSIEEYARDQQYRFVCFAEETHVQHPQKPKNYIELGPFWNKRGYEKTDLTVKFTWKTIRPNGSPEDEEHTLYYWIKEIFPIATVSSQQVTVIGAGPAGLLAAYRLKQAGIPVRVMEARSRVGGRMFSDAEHMIEFGPWSLGDGGNIDYIRSLSAELGIELFAARMPFPGYVLNGDHFTALSERFKECIGDSEKTKTDLAGIIDSCTTLQEVLDLFFKDYPDLKHYCEMTSWVYHGSPAHMISARYYKESIIELCLGGVSDLYKHAEPFFPLYRIRGGNDLLAKKLAEQLEGNIVLNKQLTAIGKGDERRYTLTFADGSIQEADNVILALPVSAYGTLEVKDGVIPEVQLNGINATCPGTVAKVLVPSQGNVLPLGFFIGEGFSAGITSDEQYLTMHWARPVDMQVIAEKIAAICRLLGWPLPRDVIKIADAGLRHYPLDAALVADWPHNLYTQGSYCAFSPAQDQLMGFDEIEGITVQRLFKPAGGIYFAGEAASVTAAPGSVGAAFESAEIVVKLLIKRLRQGK